MSQKRIEHGICFEIDTTPLSDANEQIQPKEFVKETKQNKIIIYYVHTEL